MLQHRLLVVALVSAGLAFGSAAVAQTTPLPLPEYGTMTDIPGAANRPDPALNYKLVFDVTRGSGSTAKHPDLIGVARLINTFAQHDVPVSHRNFVIVIHGPATAIVMTDTAFAVRTGAKANPNTQLIRDLRKAGVKIHVCGQAARGMNISQDMQMPEITQDLSGGISLINFQTRGYVRVGN